MKPTGTVRRSSGITRRLDELGRVTVPKSIRRSLRIRDGDALEIFTGHDGEIIFKKYSPIGELTSFAEEYAETLYKTCGLSVLICDRDGVIAAAGVSPRKEYLDRSLTEELETLMEKRSLYILRDGSEKVIAVQGTTAHVSCAMPILAEGDIVGAVVSLTGEKADRPLSGDTESKLIQTAAAFLGKNLES
ncbi:MAG: stage V sporulation protein T [Clostridia bacterium]|nr:stage V sporulation protein T [Clostridia bacterium]